MPDGAPLIDPDIVAGRIGLLLQERRRGAVKPLLAALAKLAPEHRDLALLRAEYCCQTEDIAQALLVLQEAIARQPENAALYLRRAEICYNRGDFAGAAANAADALLHAPGFNRAKSTLGLALFGLQKFDLALPCLTESFAADPAGVDVALALAALKPETAIATLTRAIAASPRVSVLRNALTRRHLCAGDPRQALHGIEQTRADGAADADTYCLQAFAQMQESDWNEAAASAAQAQSLNPGSGWAARLAAALASRPGGTLDLPPEPDAARAEQAQLAGGTILPGSFRALLQELPCRGPVLDLFCGTGLNVITAQDVCAGPWTGIDADAELLRLCAERNIYARLERCSPLDFLQGLATRSSPYKVILLNEALATTESLQPWFDALRGCLVADGVALAAIPVGRPGLTGHALFAHSLESVAADAERAGLGVAIARSGTMRHVEGIPVHGVIANFRSL